jgi:hypothetical protein
MSGSSDYDLPENGDFLKLIQECFLENKRFNLSRHLQKCCEPDSSMGMDELDFSELLPGIELVAEYKDYDIGYHSRCCNCKAAVLYKYKDEYIVYSFDVEASGSESDLDALRIQYHYGNERTLLNECVNVYNMDDFDCEKFLNVSPVNDLSFMIDVFKGVYGENGLRHLKKYVSKRYKNRRKKKK